MNKVNKFSLTNRLSIVNKLTLRHLKLNKKRTLVTIIGIIISVAMITAVSTLSISFVDVMARQEIATNGEWHVSYKDVNREQIAGIVNDKNTKSIILNKRIGYAPLEGSQNRNKPYLYIEGYNKAGFENMPFELSDGKFPENSKEIVISEAIITNGMVEYKIGDSITLDIGNRYSDSDKNRDMKLSQDSVLRKENGVLSENLTKELTKTYIIVGKIKRPNNEPTWSPGYTVLTYLDEDNLEPKETLTSAVILKKINSKLFKEAETFAEDNGIMDVDFHNELLRYYGLIKEDSARTTMIKLIAIIMAVIAIGSISLIYNAFAISVSERSRHLGMLSSVGATKRQKRNSVFFEGFILGSISIPIGIIFGILGIGITFLFVNPMLVGSLGITESFRVVVSPLIIIVSIIVSAITILISTYIPARRASNISAIEAIRQTTDIKLTRRNVKTSKITGRIFGIEGDIALKNLKRNKKRYMATVFSLVISIVLFLVVDTFNMDLKKSITLTQEGINYDIVIYESHIEEKDSVIEKIKSLQHVTESSYISKFQVETLVDESSGADYLKGRYEGLLKDGKYKYYVNIIGLNDEALKKYANEVEVDVNLLKDTQKLGAIVIDTVKYKDKKTDKYVEAKILKTSVGQNLQLEYSKAETQEKEVLNPVNILALTDKMPMGVTSNRDNPLFDIIVSMDTLKQIKVDNKRENMNIRTEMYVKSDSPLAVQDEIEKIVNPEGAEKNTIFNLFMERQREEQMILLLAIFEYGFIILITFISITNIFNTISTSIALRKKEFAMLKSVGMTPKGFNKMINYESIFYGIKALLYGLPISFAFMYLIHKVLMHEFDFKFTIPWVSVLIAIVSVFFVVGTTMIYSSSKIRKENIIDALKQEII